MPRVNAMLRWPNRVGADAQKLKSTANKFVQHLLLLHNAKRLVGP